MSIYNHTTNGTEVQQKSNGAKPDTYKLKPRLLDNANVDPRLSWFDFCVLYRLLAHYRHDTSKCYPSEEWLAEALHTSERNVRRAIQNLLDTGWIFVTRRFQQTSLYTFAWDRAVKLDLSNPRHDKSGEFSNRRQDKSVLSKIGQIQQQDRTDLAQDRPDLAQDRTELSYKPIEEEPIEEELIEEANTRVSAKANKKVPRKGKGRAKDAPGTAKVPPTDPDLQFNGSMPSIDPSLQTVGDSLPPKERTRELPRGGKQVLPHSNTEGASIPPDVPGDQSQAADDQSQADQELILLWARHAAGREEARPKGFAFPQGILDYYAKHGVLTDGQIATAEKQMAKDKAFQVAKDKAFAPTVAEMLKGQARQEKVRQEYQELNREASDRHYRKMMGEDNVEQQKPKPNVERFIEQLKEATSNDEPYQPNGFVYTGGR